MDLLNENIIIGGDYSARLVELINNARKNIKICVFDWRVHLENSYELNQFNQAVYSASGRGVFVQAIVNSDLIIAKLRENKVRVRRAGTGKILHAKFIIIDDEILVIGSHNFTANAFSANLEVSVICKIDPNNCRLLDFFKNLYGV